MGQPAQGHEHPAAGKSRHRLSLAKCVKPHRCANIITRLNGKEVSRYSTRNMIFSLQHYIARITQYCTLMPGDVIWTGVDNATIPDLEDGMVCEIEQKDIGVLRNPVTRAKAVTTRLFTKDLYVSR